MSEHQRGATKDEIFITDVAYCEQAVIFLKQAKLPQNNSQRRKEDGTLPVSTLHSPTVLKTLCKLGIKGKCWNVLLHLFLTLIFSGGCESVSGI